MKTNKKPKELDFTAEIKKFHTEFPEHHRKVFIVNPDKHDSIASFLSENPDFIKKQKQYQNIEALRENGAKLTDINQFIGVIFKEEKVEKLYKLGGFCMNIFNINSLIDTENNIKCDINFINLILPKIDVEYLKLTNTESTEILQKYVLYHEFGHALYDQQNKKNVISSFSKGSKTLEKFKYQTEAAAESYSLIRLLQEYGIDNPEINSIFTKRTVGRLKQIKSIYNFLPAIHEVARLAKQGKLDNLTPQESAELANKIAKEKTISVENSKKIDSTLWNLYSSLHSGKPLLEFARKNIIDATEPVVINDIQYILKCLEATASNNPKIQAVVKDAWNALKENGLVKKQGLLQQHWHAEKLKNNKKPAINQHQIIRKKIRF